MPASAAARPPMPITPPSRHAETRILGGRYVLERRIGGGAMADVFLALDQHDDELVAVKVVKPKRLKRRRTRERFAVEVHALGSVAHPNLVELRDVGTTDELPFLVMELVPGVSLQEWVRDHGPLPPRLAAELLRAAGMGLEAMHQRGILHRDIKPGNVLLAVADGRPVDAQISDLGLAKLASARGLTREGTMMGSPSYMAPEQVTGDPADVRSDIYGWGMTLFFAVAGRRAFEGSREQLLTHQLRTPPPPASSFVSELGAELDCILSSALRKHPANRYPSMRHVLRDLDALLGAASPPAGAPLQVRPDEYLPLRPSAPPWRADPADPDGTAETLSPDD